VGRWNVTRLGDAVRGSAIAAAMGGSPLSRAVRSGVNDDAALGCVVMMGQRCSAPLEYETKRRTDQQNLI